MCLTGRAGGHSGEGRRPGKQVSRWLVPSVPSRDLVAPNPWHGASVNSLYTTTNPVLPCPPPGFCGHTPSPKTAGKPDPRGQGAEVAAPAPCPAHHLAEDISWSVPGEPWGPGAASVGSFPTTGLPDPAIPGQGEPRWPWDNSGLRLPLLSARLPPVRNLRSGLWQNALFSHTHILKGYRPCVRNRQNIRSLVSLRTIIRFARGQVDTKNLSRPGLWMGLSPPLQLMKFSTRGYLS